MIQSNIHTLIIDEIVKFTNIVKNINNLMFMIPMKTVMYTENKNWMLFKQYIILFNQLHTERPVSTEYNAK